MKTLRGFQKRRYGTPLTVIGQHATRTRAAIPEISRPLDHAHDIEKQGNDKNVGIENNEEEVQEYLFEGGETVVFRGTDGSKFNLRITRNVKEYVTLRTKIRGNGSVLFHEDPAWKRSSMAFARILHDKDENIVTANLPEINNLKETLFQMDNETNDEIVSISRGL